MIWLVLCTSVRAQDVGVVIRDDVLNRFLSHIGPVSGSGQTNVALSTVSYSWTVSEPKITFKPEKGAFRAMVAINAGIIKYSTPAEGDIKVTIDNKRNRIQFKVKKAEFELYTNLFGNRIHIAFIDIAKFFPISFEMPAPDPYNETIILDGPNGIKKLNVSTGDRFVRFHEGYITVGSLLKISEVKATKNALNK